MHGAQTTGLGLYRERIIRVAVCLYGRVQRTPKHAGKVMDLG